MRKIKIKRQTKETSVAVELNLDGRGEYTIDTGIGFLNHMLELFSKHSLVDLTIKAEGDLQHHVVEDVGIALGQAFEEALGNKIGINRFGYAIIPMDESLALAVADLGGRAHLVMDAGIERLEVEDFETEALQDFFEAFASNCKCNLHLKILYGRNAHHKIEALFKAFARAMKIAVAIDERIKDVLPTTKGKL